MPTETNLDISLESQVEFGSGPKSEYNVRGSSMAGVGIDPLAKPYTQEISIKPKDPNEQEEAPSE